MTHQAPTKHATARRAMIEAWSAARQGQAIFGGSIRSYLAEALRQAWAELLADPVVQEVAKLIAAIKGRRAAGTWQHPADHASAYGDPAGTWIGQ